MAPHISKEYYRLLVRNSRFRRLLPGISSILENERNGRDGGGGIEKI